jgi:hypothetical protein
MIAFYDYQGAMPLGGTPLRTLEYVRAHAPVVGDVSASAEFRVRTRILYVSSLSPLVYSGCAADVGADRVCRFINWFDCVGSLLL